MYCVACKYGYVPSMKEKPKSGKTSSKTKECLQENSYSYKSAYLHLLG